MNNQKIRRLTAIMFTDIIGYTALMQQDEQTAARVRARHREVFDQQHELHKGEILQYFGDGTLSVFQGSGMRSRYSKGDATRGACSFTNWFAHGRYHF
jgi:class 3 adenylate cyclase